MVILKKGDIRVFKVIVIGDSAVGKTCLTCRFCCGNFPVKTEVTIGVDFREKCVEIEDETIKMQFWDTAGQERFRKSMIQHYYRGVHAVVFVYDVTSQASFESLPAWIAECEKHNLSETSVPRILIGNKVDMGEQRVNTQLAQKFADAHSMPLFETSALDDSSANHVESIFLTLALKLKASKPMMNSPNDSSGKSAVSVPPSIVLHRADVTGVDHEGDNSGSCMC